MGNKKIYVKGERNFDKNEIIMCHTLQSVTCSLLSLFILWIKTNKNKQTTNTRIQLEIYMH